MLPEACLYIRQIISSKFFRTSGESVRGSGNFKERIRQWKWAIIQPNFGPPPPLHISELALRLRTENFDDTVSRRFYASSWSRSRDQQNFGREGAAVLLVDMYLACNMQNIVSQWIQPRKGIAPNILKEICPGMQSLEKRTNTYFACEDSLEKLSKSGGLRGFRARGYWA